MYGPIEAARAPGSAVGWQEGAVVEELALLYALDPSDVGWATKKLG